MKRRLGSAFFPVMVVLVILVAYFPVAFQLLSLKNDVIQLDLPVKFFISKEIHRGQLPTWMYSWAGGFPLGHLFSWSIYNPVTLFFTTLFEYDITILHLEYLFYLIIGAGGIYKICTKIFYLTASSAAIAALVYALSGITISCSQFMAYIASIAFLPWIYYCFILLLKKPSLLRCLVFALSAFLLVSWSYPAGIIIGIYSVFALALVAHFSFGFSITNRKFLGYLLLSVIVILALSLPLIYTTAHTLPYFSRSEKLTNFDNNFGYLHPTSLLSFFYPFYNVSVPYPETTFLFQNVSIGLVGFGMLASGLRIGNLHGKRKKAVFWLMFSAIVAICFSFGDVFILRSWTNEILPGFKWFRFPSFFRIFFLLPAAILIGILLDQLAVNRHSIKPILKIHRAILAFFCSVAVLLSFHSLYQATDAFTDITVNSFFPQNGGLQKSFSLIFLVWTLMLLLIIFLRKNLINHIPKLIVVDLVLTSLLSLPIYAISNYSPRQMQTILKTDAWSTQIKVDRAEGIYVDNKGNPFNGLNVYVNSINVDDQYWGPLYLKSYPQLLQSGYADHPPSELIFIANQKASEKVEMRNNTFKDHTFSAQISTSGVQKVILFQLAHPFWKGYINNQQVPVLQSAEGLAYVNYFGGNHEVKFVLQDSLLDIFNLVFFLTFPSLILAIILLKWRCRNV